ncbi:beta-lactamase family protein [Methanococcoides sp. SA1]|nr:beta-lactamase family protein [Methanococcoides sp. SA1]
MKYKTISFILTIFLIVFSFTFGSDQIENIKLGQSKQKPINVNEAHKYRLKIKANKFVYGTLLQKRADVIIKIYDPNGKMISEVDSPSGYNGIENITFTTIEKGNYTFEITAASQIEEKSSYDFQIRSIKNAATSNSEKVDQLFKPWDDINSPGAAVAIIKDGKVIYKKGFGAANLEYDIPITSESTFNLCSVSKQFTAFAVAYLADQGKINLDDDIRKYIPEMHDFGKTITVKNLIHQTSGLRDDIQLMRLAGWRYEDVVTRDQMLKLAIKQRHLNFNPGEEWMYSNSNYTLMAEIVERVSGQQFGEWAKEHIFVPLEMTNTLYFEDLSILIKNRVYSYESGTKQRYKNRGLSYVNAGPTNVYTTLDDLIKWTNNFDNPKEEFGPIIKQMEEQAILNNGDTNFYAFGQALVPYKGIKRIYHDGSQAGFRTSLIRYPEEKLSIIVLSNVASFKPTIMIERITDIYLADKINENDSNDMPSHQHSPYSDLEPLNLSKEELSEFEGKFYSNELDITYQLNVIDNQLVAQHLRQEDILFTPKKTDFFEGNVHYFRDVQFVKNEDNQIIGFDVSTARLRNVHFSKISKKLK